MRLCGSDTAGLTDPELGIRCSILDGRPLSDVVRKVLWVLGLSGDGRTGFSGTWRNVDVDLRDPVGRATSVVVDCCVDVLAPELDVTPFVVEGVLDVVDASPIEETDFTSSSWECAESGGEGRPFELAGGGSRRMIGVGGEDSSLRFPWATSRSMYCAGILLEAGGVKIGGGVPACEPKLWFWECRLDLYA